MWLDVLGDVALVVFVCGGEDVSREESLMRHWNAASKRESESVLGVVGGSRCGVVCAGQILSMKGLIWSTWH